MKRKQIDRFIKIEKKHIWHPFTQMADWQSETPLIIKSGRGVYLKDVESKKYIDGVSSLWVNIHGHRNTRLDEALKEQLNKIAHSTFLGLTHIPAIELAKKLVEILPKNLKRIFYSDNGSTAVEVALKMAYQYWLHMGAIKNRYLSLKNAYHGDTIGSVSVGGIALFHEKFGQLLFKTYFAPSPYCYRCRYRGQGSGVRGQKKNILFGRTTHNLRFKNHCLKMNCSGYCLKLVEDILTNHKSEIAAAVVEPMIQAAAGMLTMPPGYLKEFATLCKKHGVLLIADEVATGFGHTGKMFACEIEGIKPDFLCLAKGITGGYLPLAATITTEKIYRAFLGKYEEFRAFFHGHTYTANPLACACAIENLRIFKRKNVIARLGKKIQYLTLELEKLKEHKNIGEIRQLGLMAGIELVKDRKTKEVFEASEKIANKLCNNARKYGVILRPLGNVVVILPPLSINQKELQRIIFSISRSLDEIVGDED